MPKAVWSNSDLSADAINSAEERDGGYTGPLPTRGVYRFKLQKMEPGISGSGGDKLVIFLTLDGTWKPEHKKYNGCPLWDHMPLGASSAFRPKALCAALGVTAADFLNNTIVNDDGIVTKIGKKPIKKDMLVYVSIKAKNDEGYDPGIQLNGGGYLPEPDSADDEGDGDADEAPAATKKGGKKKGKGKGGESPEEDPF